MEAVQDAKKTTIARTDYHTGQWFLASFYGIEIVSENVITTRICILREGNIFSHVCLSFCLVPT